MCRTPPTSWSSTSTRTRWSATFPTRRASTASRSRRSSNRGFISNGRGNNVTIFDLKTLKPIGTGRRPARTRTPSATTPVSGRVFTFNGRSKNSTAIDAKTGKVVGTIPLPGKPEFSVADGKGKVYVNIEDTSEIVEIDAAKATVIEEVRADRRATGRRASRSTRRTAGCSRSAGNRRDGGVGSRRRQGRRDAGDRRGLRRRGVRSGHRLRVQLERRRHADGRAADRRQVGRAREHRDRARRADDRARREDAQGLSCRPRRPDRRAGRRPRDRSCRTRSRCWWSANEDAIAGALRLVLRRCERGRRAQDAPRRAAASRSRIPRRRPAPPSSITLQDALQRARQNDAQFQAVVADAAIAREDRVQAKAAPAAGVQRDDAVPRQPGDTA